MLGKPCLAKLSRLAPLRTCTRRLSTIVSAQRQGAGLQIEFSCGGGGYYPLLWLRDASPAPAHQLKSGQRLFETHELPESAELECEFKSWSADALELEWDRGVAARYPAELLRQFAPGGAAAPGRERYAGRTLWATPAELALEAHAWPAVASGEALLPLLRALRRYGVAKLASQASLRVGRAFCRGSSGSASGCADAPAPIVLDRAARLYNCGPRLRTGCPRQNTRLNASVLEEPERLGPPKTRRQTAAKSSMLPLMNPQHKKPPQLLNLCLIHRIYTQLNARN